MEWLFELVSACWWLIIAVPALAVVVIVVLLFADSKGPYPKIVVHTEEKTFVDAKTGLLKQ